MLPDLLDSKDLLGSYDIILAAETIYSLDSQKQLLHCIKKVRQRYHRKLYQQTA